MTDAVPEKDVQVDLGHTGRNGNLGRLRALAMSETRSQIQCRAQAYLLDLDVGKVFQSFGAAVFKYTFLREIQLSEALLGFSPNYIIG